MKTKQKAPADNPGAPYCAPFDPNPRQPELALPPLSCDCHAHICGPASDYDYAPERIYTPPDALLSDYLSMLATVGVERTVLIQPSVYGSDNTVMLHAMAECPFPCRGVAVVEDTVSDSEIEALHGAGVRGIRFNVVDVRDPGGAVPWEEIKALSARVAPLGWHAEFLIHADDYPDFDAVFADFPVDVVFGHLGYMRPPLSLDDPGFQGLLRLLKEGRGWVKLTGPSRITAVDTPYPDVTPVAHALMEAAPDRIIWGTDWPHVKISKTMPNDADTVDLLSEWIPDPALRQRVLVDNPTTLYGFE
jgi:2-pyrone-4,6-dicarboxylate lactonase